MRSLNLRKVDFFQEKAVVLKVVVDTGKLRKMRLLSETRKKRKKRQRTKARFFETQEDSEF